MWSRVFILRASSWIRSADLHIIIQWSTQSCSHWEKVKWSSELTNAGIFPIINHKSSKRIAPSIDVHTWIAIPKNSNWKANFLHYRFVTIGKGTNHIQGEILCFPTELDINTEMSDFQPFYLYVLQAKCSLRHSTVLPVYLYLATYLSVLVLSCWTMCPIFSSTRNSTSATLNMDTLYLVFICIELI